MAKWKERMTETAPVPVRLALGSTMLYHGTTKLTRQGIEASVPFFEQVGIKPGRPWVIATGVTEALAGALLLGGIGTRLAALGVLATQGVAIAKVHAKRGFAVEKQGFEFNLALCAIALGLFLRGPGRISVHDLARRKARAREIRHGKFLPKQRTVTRMLEMLA